MSVIAEKTYLATVWNANSTFSPVFAEVSIKGTLCSRANRSPSSRFTCRSLLLQSDLLPIRSEKSGIWKMKENKKLWINTIIGFCFAYANFLQKLVYPLEFSRHVRLFAIWFPFPDEWMSYLLGQWRHLLGHNLVFHITRLVYYHMLFYL